MNFIAIGPIQLLFIIPGILGFASLIYVIFYNKKEHNKKIKLLPQIFLYLFSLVPLGLIIGLYIVLRRRKEEGVFFYKYSERSRLNATMIIVISLVSTLLSFYNLTTS